jgi:hypothetical protein
MIQVPMKKRPRAVHYWQFTNKRDDKIPDWVAQRLSFIDNHGNRGGTAHMKHSVTGKVIVPVGYYYVLDVIGATEVAASMTEEQFNLLHEEVILDANISSVFRSGKGSKNPG